MTKPAASRPSFYRLDGNTVVVWSHWRMRKSEERSTERIRYQKVVPMSATAQDKIISMMRPYHIFTFQAADPRETRIDMMLVVELGAI